MDQKITQAYLRTCGVICKLQDLLYAAAKKAYKESTVIDWTDPLLCIGELSFPAAWAGDLPICHFIKMIMHLMFLGIAESNFALCNIHLKNLHKLETFKNEPRIC
jgi:hypothetical protein